MYVWKAKKIGTMPHNYSPITKQNLENNNLKDTNIIKYTNKKVLLE